MHPIWQNSIYHFLTWGEGGGGPNVIITHAALNLNVQAPHGHQTWDPLHHILDIRRGTPHHILDIRPETPPAGDIWWSSLFKLIHLRNPLLP